MRKLNKKIFIDARLKLITGLRIGDNKENVEIGGIDNPIVRRKDNLEPYLPGSSIKGKIRCLLELAKGENVDSNAKQTGSLICQLFGASENKKESMDGNPSRIIVRDAYLTDNSRKQLAESEFTDMPFSEIKWENVINRIKGSAEHPRQMERIPAGAEFDLHFVINIFEGDEEGKLLNTFKKGLELLQDDYLGGSGSRGYGQISVEDIKQNTKDASSYLVP
ncbi:type III-A CRISPR-associated RAMP protein Csm3 [Catalinimonas sp. 4WD22]|uniref:type III-A CRISPR-associated RAMP protein Csm3 n=1 Tax=Catalinimonas locisalis TaxID=3133978 RepID=UPI003100F75D